MHRFLTLLLTPFLLSSILLPLGGCEAPRPLKVGSNQWPGYEPMYLARERGLLPEEDVKLVELPSSSDVMQYLRNGSLDAGMLTLDEVISLLADGLELKVVLVMDVSHGADAVLARPGIDSLAAMRGHRIGVEISALGALMLESALRAAGLSIDEVEVVNLTVDRHLEAFRNGEVDVLITFEPTRSQLLAEGARVLFDSRAMPQRIIDVLAVRAPVAEARPQRIEGMLRAYFEARREMQHRPERAYPLIARRLDTTPETLQIMYAGMILPDLRENRKWLEPEGPLERSAAELALLMREWNMIQTLPDTTRLGTPRFLPEP